MRLSNATIYSSSTNLYITSGDHSLIEVVGDDVALVEKILAGLAAMESLDSIYERIQVELDDDRDYFDEIIAWLQEQGIVIAEPESAPQAVATFLHAPYLKTGPSDELLVRLSGLGPREYKPVSDHQEAELILMLSPLFEYQEEVMNLSRYAYQQRIPICHIGIDTSTFTLGPLMDAAVGTPCLNCYLRRKLANLKNPQKTLTFIQHPNKARLVQADPQSTPYFGVALTHLAVELNKFFSSTKQSSPLLGKSIVFDHFDYSITKSKILRVPGCEVCNPTSAYSALNG